MSSEQNLERIRGAGTWVCRLCLDIFNFSILFYWPNGGSSSTWGMSRTLRGVKEQQALEYAGRALEMMGRGRGGDTSLSLSLSDQWALLMHSNSYSPHSSTSVFSCGHSCWCTQTDLLHAAVLQCSAVTNIADALCEQTMPTGQRRSVITITEKASLVPAH